MKAGLISLCLALLATGWGGALPVHVGGRATPEMRFGWPGTYFESRFDGRSVTAEVETASDFFHLSVDGIERARLGPGNTRVTVEPLADGPHVVRLEMATENQGGSSRFIGFHAPGKALPLVPRKRRIEFIGDSHSVGYGNLSPTRDCNAQRVHDMTDTQRAFGPLLAKRLDADYRVIAYSGFGVVRNYNGGAAGDSLPRRYARTIPAEPAEQRDQGWRPDWIVINLGTNDFSTPLHPGEAWADAAALHADFRARYADFVRMLAARRPGARIVLMAAPEWRADILAVVRATNGQGRVSMIDNPPMDLSGCNGHPSLADHRRIAVALEAWLRRAGQRAGASS